MSCPTIYRENISVAVEHREVQVLPLSSLSSIILQ